MISETAAEPEQAAVRRRLAHELNQMFRRLRQYEKEADWVRLVMEGAGQYASQVALFAVQGDGPMTLELRGAVNLELAVRLRLEAPEAAAFAEVLRSKEPVTTMRTSGEVSVALSTPGGLACLFPILHGTRVAAILFAAGEGLEMESLELISNMAASALERQANRAIHAHIDLVPAPMPAEPKVSAPVPERRLPRWAELPADTRALHSRAARFARVAVAELQLLKPAACRTARESGELYVLLGKELDKSREAYRKQFMTVPSMTDYFHQELVRVILEGDAKKLGADYPGELV